MCYNADDMKGIDTTSSTFEKFIGLGTLYVDKTRYAYALVNDPEKRSFFFLSRPRRYGKSLFCSTLHALFDGRRDLFEGLYIAERTDYSFERFPVIHLIREVPRDTPQLRPHIHIHVRALRGEVRRHDPRGGEGGRRRGRGR